MISRRILYPLALLYGAGVWLRNRLYDRNIRTSVMFDLPVICVGNLKAGGEGKTPHIEYLIRLLQHDYRVATLSRGYKRKTKGFRLVQADGTAREYGDEPLQFKRKFPQIPVAVDSNRALGVAFLLAEHEDLQVVLLDDAFQHRSVRAGLNILLTGYACPYTDDALLPAGYLREPVSGAARADVIVVTKCPDQLAPQEQQRLRNVLKPLPHQQLFFSGIRYGGLVPLAGQRQPKPATRCVLVTGIANPEPLLEHCHNQFSEVKHIRFGDHHDFSVEDVRQVMAAWKELNDPEAVVVTTEKDAVRLRAPQLQTLVGQLPVYYIPIEIYFLHDEHAFQQTVLTYVRSYPTNH